MAFISWNGHSCRRLQLLGFKIHELGLSSSRRPWGSQVFDQWILLLSLGRGGISHCLLGLHLLVLCASIAFSVHCRRFLTFIARGLSVSFHPTVHQVNLDLQSRLSEYQRRS